MRKLLILLVACLIYQPLLSQVVSPRQGMPEKLQLGFNKNIELLGFGYFLAFEGRDIEGKTVEIDGEEWPKKEWHSYGFHFYKQYQSYAESENLLQALSVADHLWLDYLIKLLLQVNDFPNAKLTADIKEGDYIRFSTERNPQEARQNIQLFLDGLNAFYKEVQFEKYLAESRIYYEAALEEVKRNLPNTTFIEDLEQFYGRKFDAYYLVPSLTLPKGMGFGLNPVQNHVYNVFGAFDRQIFLMTDQAEMGFDNDQKIRELSIHEFGHSFVNPVIATIPEVFVSGTIGLFEPIRDAMAEQGYTNWMGSLSEHFVRAGEILIARQTASEEDAARLSKEYIEKRKFIYIPAILKELEAYSHAGTYPYEEAVRRSMSALNNISDSIGSPSGASHFPTKPLEAKFHTEDIFRFWEVFDRSYPRFKGKKWQEEYLDQGSIGLKAFVKNRIGNGRLLAKTIRRNLKYYEAIRQASLSIDQQKERFYESFGQLKKLYPDAVFPDVFFVIGRRNTGGAIFDRGLIIGAERFGKPHKNFQPDICFDHLNDVIAHELIHFQQHYVQDNSLLAQCIREGAADFLGEMISGSHMNTAMYKYGDAHEAALKKEFLSRKDSKDWSGWLYYSRDKSRPEDLGYWIGYKICQAYYGQMEDKVQAIQAILNIRDFNDFLEKSRYVELE